MRYLVLLVACIYAHSVYASDADDDIALLDNIQHDALGKDSISYSHKFKRDTYSDVYQSLLEDLAKALRNEEFGRQTQYAPDDLDLHREVVHKRKAFWQSMGGPLPVQTRLASFGSRIEPDRTGGSQPQRFKAMRYGRRR